MDSKPPTKKRRRVSLCCCGSDGASSVASLTDEDYDRELGPTKRRLTYDIEDASPQGCFGTTSNIGSEWTPSTPSSEDISQNQWQNATSQHLVSHGSRMSPKPAEFAKTPKFVLSPNKSFFTEQQEMHIENMRREGFGPSSDDPFCSSIGPDIASPRKANGQIGLLRASPKKCPASTPKTQSSHIAQVKDAFDKRKTLGHKNESMNRFKFAMSPPLTDVQMTWGVEERISLDQKQELKIPFKLPIPPHLMINFNATSSTTYPAPSPPASWVTERVHCMLEQKFSIIPQLAPASQQLILSTKFIEARGLRLLGSNSDIDGVIKVQVRRTFLELVSQLKQATTNPQISSLRKRTPVLRDASHIPDSPFVGCYALKLRRSQGDYNRLYHETVILDHLQTSGCFTCPHWLVYGVVSLSSTDYWRALLTESVGKSFYDTFVSLYVDRLDELGAVVPVWWQRMKNAVRDLHEHDVIHGDLKPSHFIVVEEAMPPSTRPHTRSNDAQNTKSSRLKIIDYGASHIVPRGTVRAPARLVTQDWASKEQLDQNMASFDGDFISTFYSLVSMLVNLYVGCFSLPQQHQYYCASHIFQFTPQSARPYLHQIAKELVPRGLIYLA